MVTAGKARLSSDVRDDFNRTVFLSGMHYKGRGWAADVMRCVERLVPRGGDFALGEIYAFETELGERHQQNRHVRAKIRQQLQVLRDAGYLRFLGRGQYERL